MTLLWQMLCCAEVRFTLSFFISLCSPLLYARVALFVVFLWLFLSPSLILYLFLSRTQSFSLCSAHCIGMVSTVELLAKSEPTFVSDAMEKDIHYTINWLGRGTEGERKAGGKGEIPTPSHCVLLSKSLEEHLKSGRLIISSHSFFNTGRTYVFTWDGLYISRPLINHLP